ncbi:MAG: LytTR family transcriptional regulator [Gemmatimonadaceae bacterium]|nr:LytTR family transcriptional regulator [Gemmatimonadaceae bacterium]
MPTRRAHEGLPGMRVLLAGAVLGMAALTLQILVVHGLGGRGTPVWHAAGWAIATIGVWVPVTMFAFVLARGMVTGRGRPVTRLLGMLALAFGCVIAASALRAFIDPLLPQAAQQTVPSLELFGRFLARWSGPGLLIALAVVALPWLTARFDSAPSTEQATPVTFAERMEGSTLSTLVVRIGDRSVPVAVADLLWISAAGNYAELHGPRGRQLARITMSELERRLDPTRFVRVHRSSIIALDAVREVRRNGGSVEVVLSNGQAIALSRLGRKALEERLGRRG